MVGSINPRFTSDKQIESFLASNKFTPAAKRVWANELADRGRTVTQTNGQWVVAPAGSSATDTGTGTQTRGYVPTAETKDVPRAILLQEEAGAGGFGNSSGASSSGMLSDNQPLGTTLDDDNRYLRRGGAVLLR